MCLEVIPRLREELTLDQGVVFRLDGEEVEEAVSWVLPPSDRAIAVQLVHTSAMVVVRLRSEAVSYQDFSATQASSKRVLLTLSMVPDVVVVGPHLLREAWSKHSVSE